MCEDLLLSFIDKYSRKDKIQTYENLSIKTSILQR